MKKFIVFDFDGTIATTDPQFAVDIINRFSDEFGYKKIKVKDIDKLRNKKSQEIFKDLGISIFKLPFLIKKIKVEYNESIKFLKPVPGIRKVLLKLKKSGYKLGILTSNTKENVSKFLKRNNLDLFDFIYSESSIFGKGRIIKSLLKNQNIKPEEVTYVGDETRDIEAARKTNVKMIAVSWGINSKEILKKQKPDFLVDKPRELVDIFKSF